MSDDPDQDVTDEERVARSSSRHEDVEEAVAPEPQDAAARKTPRRRGRNWHSAETSDRR